MENKEKKNNLEIFFYEERNEITKRNFKRNNKREKMKETITKIILFLCLLIGITYANNLITIDDFSINAQVLIISLSNPPQLPSTVTSFQTDSVGSSSKNILGGERDLALTLTTGSAGRVATAGVSQNSFNAAFPNGASGYSLLQYDGIDNSIDVNTTGFTAIPEASTGVNFLLNNGAAFNLTYQIDIETSGFIYVFDIYGGISSVEIDFDGGSVKKSLVLPFSIFQGYANFAHVGAVELYFTGDNNVDIILSYFGTMTN